MAWELLKATRQEARCSLGFAAKAIEAQTPEMMCCFCGSHEENATI